MLDALADAVQEQTGAKYALKGRREGLAREGWVLVDLGEVVVHLFSPERRSYYRLEELWSQGKVLIRLQ